MSKYFDPYLVECVQLPQTARRAFVYAGLNCTQKARTPIHARTIYQNGWRAFVYAIVRFVQLKPKFVQLFSKRYYTTKPRVHETSVRIVQSSRAKFVQYTYSRTV
jgi:hypothetical protein